MPVDAIGWHGTCFQPNSAALLPMPVALCGYLDVQPPPPPQLVNLEGLRVLVYNVGGVAQWADLVALQVDLFLL